MTLLEILLFWLHVGAFVHCELEAGTNIASLDNGGQCQKPLNRVACSTLIDGIRTGASGNRWLAGSNIIGQWVQFDFNATYSIKRIVVTHSYQADERNIKQVRLTFGDGKSILFDLKNNVTGKLQNDSVHLSATSNYMNMTITEVYTEDAFTAVYEVEVFAAGIMIVPTVQTSAFTTNTAATTMTTSPMSTSTISSSTATPKSSTTSKATISTTSSTVPTSTISRTKDTTIKARSPTSTTETEIAEVPDATSTAKTTPFMTDIIDITTVGGDMGVKADLSSGNLPIEIIVGVVMAILVIAVVLLVVFLIFLRRRRKKNVDEQPTDENVYVNMRTIESTSKPESTTQIPIIEPPKYDKKLDSSPETSPESSVQDLKLVDGEPEYTDTQPLPVYSNVIKLDELASTVDDLLHNPVRFQEEFKSIPAGKQHPTTFADRSTLHTKNRFRNIKPYDHSRVSLMQKESDDSVYINANFISAYNQPKYYIAAQGPNKNSLNDFWRMIWEHRVPVIVMVTNCKEAGKDKCTKYWPDQGDDKLTYDDLDVVFDKNYIMADYKIRDFKISKRGEIRAVRQYHYTSWPDEGVPTSCSALISFINRIREYTDDKDPPNVVHCSAGVGRTGTFIAVNYSMDMAREESIVDIKKVVHRLREDRINMVQTLSQYKFLYALMLECVSCGEVTIPCQGASEKIPHIFIQADGKDSQAEKQWKVLEVLKPKKLEEECLAGKHKDNTEKNRTQTILPHDNNRPYLRRRPDYTSNYINAVFVDGYRKKNKFLLTQHPLANTVVDLWRTIADFNISTIVMLNSCSDDAQTYWPEDEYSETLKYGDFLEVTFKRVDKQDEFTITELQMSGDQEKANVVTHIQIKNWSEDSKPKLSILPALYNIVTQAQMADEDSRIMIHNLNGDGNTGVYCALHQIFDKIKVEQEIDIFNAVKNTRMPRPGVIPDMETYRYLHDASVQFIEQFSTYANFQ